MIGAVPQLVVLPGTALHASNCTLTITGDSQIFFLSMSVILSNGY